MSEDIELKPLGSSAPRIPPRHPEATSGSLGQAYRAAEEKAKAAVHLQEGVLDSVSVWGCGAASWSVPNSLSLPSFQCLSQSDFRFLIRFTLLAIPLLLFPRILLFFAQIPPASSIFTTSQTPAHEHYDALTPLESFLCLSCSLGLLAMAMINLFVLVPSYTPPAANPSRTPLLGILVGLLTVMAAVGLNTNSIGALGKVIGGGNAMVAIWGWWVVLFRDERGRWVKTDKKHVPDRFKRL